MNIELTEAEALVVKIYIEMAKNKTEDPRARAGFERIIRKMEENNHNNRT